MFDDWGVVQGHDEVERMLRERWDDPKAGEKDPLVVIHCRDRGNFVMATWLIATIMAAWERCRAGTEAVAKVASPTIRVLLWGGGDNELPLGRTAREWEEKSVLSIGWWKEWMNDANLASIVRVLYGGEQLPGDFGRALNFVFGWCERVYGDQRAHNLQIAYDAVAKEEAEFVGHDGKTMRVVGLPSSVRVFTNIALERGGAALLIFREDDGRVTLSWSEKFDARNAKNVARVVGIEERRAHDRGAALTFDEVVKIASKVLNPNSWEPGFAFRCKEGICGSGRNGNPICPRAIWHLRRCDDCRFEPEVGPARVQPKATDYAMEYNPKREEEKAPVPTPVPAPTPTLDVTPSV